MGTDNTQFHRIFRIWRRKASERSSTFSLRFTAIGGSVGSESAPHFNMSLWSWVRALTEAKEKGMGHAPIACEWDHPSSEWARGWGPYNKFFICLYLVLPLKPNIALINFATHRHRFKVVKNYFSYYCFSFLNIFLGTNITLTKIAKKVAHGNQF